MQLSIEPLRQRTLRFRNLVKPRFLRPLLRRQAVRTLPFRIRHHLPSLTSERERNGPIDEKCRPWHVMVRTPLRQRPF